MNLLALQFCLQGAIHFFVVVNGQTLFGGKRGQWVFLKHVPQTFNPILPHLPTSACDGQSEKGSLPYIYTLLPYITLISNLSTNSISLVQSLLKLFFFFLIVLVTYTSIGVQVNLKGEKIYFVQIVPSPANSCSTLSTHLLACDGGMSKLL